MRRFGGKVGTEQSEDDDGNGSLDVHVVINISSDIFLAGTL